MTYPSAGRASRWRRLADALRDLSPNRGRSGQPRRKPGPLDIREDRYRLEALEQRLLLSPDPVALAIPASTASPPTTDVTLRLVKDQADNKTMVQLVDNKDQD